MKHLFHRLDRIVAVVLLIFVDILRLLFEVDPDNEVRYSEPMHSRGEGHVGSLDSHRFGTFSG